QRLTTTAAPYLLPTHNIQLNPPYLHHHPPQELIPIINHHLSHYHLHLHANPYHHPHPHFKPFLKQLQPPPFSTP
ncbi:SprT-like domain-containing protein, partial [Bacillus sp. WP8]|uniref:SprT-like domain-containing protein n=1 Tax=Bacillus sp. WP8 TaxID=756828 RepID=UPI0037BF86F5